MRDEFNRNLLVKSNHKKDSEEFGLNLERSWLDGLLPAERIDDQDLNELYRYGG